MALAGGLRLPAWAPPLGWARRRGSREHFLWSFIYAVYVVHVVYCCIVYAHVFLLRESWTFHCRRGQTRERRRKIFRGPSSSEISLVCPETHPQRYPAHHSTPKRVSGYQLWASLQTWSGVLQGEFTEVTGWSVWRHDTEQTKLHPSHLA